MAIRKHDLRHRPEHGELGASISRAVVRLMAGSTGRGPTQARTTIDGDLIVVLLQNALTRGERYLADRDRADEVHAMRRAYQDVIRSDCTAAIEDLTGRTVIAFMSANHIDPDLAAEVFVLAPQPGAQHAPTISRSSADQNGDTLGGVG
jgi:uncharacterized protein YbcI